MPKPAPQQPTGNGRSHRFGTRDGLIAIGLVALTLAVFAPLAQADFITFDDPVMVRDNPHVIGGLTPANIAASFVTDVNFWTPATSLSYLVDVELHGMNAGGFHVTNIVLHLAGTLLLFGFLVRLTGSRAPSAFVAALFGVHPLHVESVSWIAERKDVLSTIFWWLTLWTYVELIARRRASRAAYALCLSLFAIGLAAKPMLVTVPLTMLLLDVWPLGRIQGRSSEWRAWWPLIREKWPFGALAGLAAVVAFVAQGAAVASMTTVPVATRLANASASYLKYLGKTLWPADLSIFYQYDLALPVVTAATGLVILITVSVVALRVMRRYPYVAVGWFWFVVTLIPVIGLVQVGSHAMADRYMYVPLVGLLIALAWGSASSVSRSPGRRLAAVAIACSLVLTSALAARAQVAHWMDGLTIWQHAADVDPDNSWAQDAVGSILTDRGRPAEAIPHFERAIAVDPSFPHAHYNLAIALTKSGRTTDAIGQFQESLRLEPEHAEARYNLGVAFAQQGRIGDAATQFREALRMRPAYVDAHRQLAHVLAIEGHVREATTEYREVVRARVDSADAHRDLSMSLLAEGRLAEAASESGEAVRRAPESADAHETMGLIFTAQQKSDEAMTEYLEAVRLDPALATAWLALGTARAGRGLSADAINAFFEAVRLEPDFAEAHFALGIALARAGRTTDAVRELREVLRLDPQSAPAKRALEALGR